ncbi:major facilitator superfamily-domain-containing protein [Cercophora newfieldiana]|uniref:Major facilitator superfamily-domain-containing protein n=1 Tax=Cercophora newfieldiana TaxID=92897 RepID=A0AA39Y9S7_9PEZI|nr:major facilitator superfamily-domain-containing protein [Cercophora newfieldiana]
MRLRSPLDRVVTADVPVVDDAAVNEKRALDKEANLSTGLAGADRESNDSSDEIDTTAQAGVQRIEAFTKVWTKRDLILAYVCIWFIYFVDAMQSSMSNSLVVYVTSDFMQHGLTATTSVLSGLIGGLSKLPLAKVLDIWGRPQGFVICLTCLVIGLIMMAACNNVEMYAAAQVFYWVGYNGVIYTIGIFIADTTHLKNRGLLLAFASSPYIITTWIGGPLAKAFLNGPGWRWGYGAFAIITPVVCSPLLYLFWINTRRAKESGLLPARPQNNRTAWESTKYYAIEFDLLGLLLIVTGLALFLLPFNIYSRQPLGWRSPLIISFLVIGFVLIIAFVLWEKYLAPKTFIPYDLLKDRTVLGACILAGTLFISFYIWDSYFFSFLQTVADLDVTPASYVMNIYSIGSCFFSFIVGFVIRYTGRFKPIALYFGIPMTILGISLMLKFRTEGVNVGYLIMCQIFIAVSGGTLVICEQIAAMAVTTHQYIAVVLAVESMFSSVGGAVGSTVAAALWNSIFPERLMEYLPEETKGNFTEIYGSLVVQRSFPVGTPTRTAINLAYSEAQKWMLVASTVIQVVSIVSVLVWRDVRIKDFKQVKGLVI